MKEPSELAKALEVVLKASAVEQKNNRERSYLSPPVVVYGEENSPEGEVHLRDYWRTIRKRLWLILGIALIVSSITAIRQARLPDIYTARSRVQVDAENYSPALGASKGATYYIDNSYVDPEYYKIDLRSQEYYYYHQDQKNYYSESNSGEPPLSKALSAGKGN